MNLGLRIVVVVFFLMCGFPVHAQKPTPVPDGEKAAARLLIGNLYKAYASRDVDKVIALERESIEASAIDYEKKGKGSADVVRRSFRECTEDVLRNKDFAMKPLNLDDVEFRLEGDSLVVSSATPIIATETVEVGEAGSGQKVRLRICKFVLRKTSDGYAIMQMFLQ